VKELKLIEMVTTVSNPPSVTVVLYWSNLHVRHRLRLEPKSGRLPTSTVWNSHCPTVCR